MENNTVIKTFIYQIQKVLAVFGALSSKISATKTPLLVVNFTLLFSLIIMPPLHLLCYYFTQLTMFAASVFPAALNLYV